MRRAGATGMKRIASSRTVLTSVSDIEVCITVLFSGVPECY